MQFSIGLRYVESILTPYHTHLRANFSSLCILSLQIKVEKNEIDIKPKTANDKKDEKKEEKVDEGAKENANNSKKKDKKDKSKNKKIKKEKRKRVSFNHNSYELMDLGGKKLD